MWPNDGTIFVILGFVIKCSRYASRFAQRVQRLLQIVISATYASIPREDYEYSPLQLPSNIRILVIEGSVLEDAPLIYRLEEVSLENAPTYRALSYAWGGQPLDRLTSCDGKRLLVSATCQAALKRMRPRNPRRQLRIWVDAICINQLSNEEKSVQVAMMDRIFREAEAVCVWLGESTRESKKFFRLIHMVENRTNLQSLIQSLKSKLFNSERLRISYVFTQGIADVAQRTYWTRIWTLQEFSLARQILLFCGPEKEISHQTIYGRLAFDLICRCEDLSALLFESLESLLWDRAPEVMPHFDRWDTLNGGPSLRGSSRHTTALHISRAMNSTEPRDKVFALRSLFPQILGTIPVDYTISLARLYTEAMKATLLHEQNLHALKLLQPAASQMLLPSWVPELSFANSLTDEYASIRSRIDSFDCSNGSKAIISFTNDPTQIVLRGCCIDIIETCHRPSSVDQHGQIYTINRFDEILSKDGQDGILDAITRSSQAIDGLKALPGFDLVEQHFSGMFYHFKHGLYSQRIEFLMSENRERSELLKMLDSPMLSRNRLWQNVDERPRSDTSFPPFEAYLSRTGHLERLRYAYNYPLLRAFFITTSGRVGSADALIEKGDQVYLFCGADVPYIVRSEGNRHRLMGAARIEGIMDGEAWPADESLLDNIVIS